MKKTKNYVPPKVTSGSRLCLEAAILTASHPVGVDYSSSIMGQEEESIEYASDWE